MLPDLGAQEFQSYAVWRSLKFGVGADAMAAAGPLADPDGDSSANLQEFAHDTEPLAAASWVLPQPMLAFPGDGNSYGALSFLRRAGTHGLAYTVQTSPDLVTWTDGWTLTDSGVVPGASLFDGGSGAQSQVRDGVPFAARAFFRLRLELR